MEYNFDIVHILGKLILVADRLSRVVGIATIKPLYRDDEYKVPRPLIEIYVLEQNINLAWTL